MDHMHVFCSEEVKVVRCIVYFRKQNQGNKVKDKKHRYLALSNREASNFLLSQISCTLDKSLTLQLLSLWFIRLYIPNIRNIIDELFPCLVKRRGGLNKDLVQECDYRWKGAGWNTSISGNLELLCTLQLQILCSTHQSV